MSAVNQMVASPCSIPRKSRPKIPPFGTRPLFQGDRGSLDQSTHAMLPKSHSRMLKVYGLQHLTPICHETGRDITHKGRRLGRTAEPQQLGLPHKGLMESPACIALGVPISGSNAGIPTAIDHETQKPCDQRPSEANLSYRTLPKVTLVPPDLKVRGGQSSGYNHPLEDVSFHLSMLGRMAVKVHTLT